MRAAGCVITTPTPGAPPRRSMAHSLVCGPSAGRGCWPTCGRITSSPAIATSSNGLIRCSEGPAGSFRTHSASTPSSAGWSLMGRGDEATGWPLAWKINLWARQHDGDHAYKLLSNLLRDATEPPPDSTKPAAETTTTTAATRPRRPTEGRSGVYPNLFD